MRLTPREALLARLERKKLAQCEGRVAAQHIAPYPPGVPVVAPGEEITKKGLAYLQEVGYNVQEDIYIVREEFHPEV